jgi:hypothetical protein
MATSHSRSSSVLGGKSKSKSSGKSKGGKPHSIHVRRGKSGGFVAQHHFKGDENGAVQEPEEHVLGSMDDLQNHMQENMGDQPPAPQAPPEPNPAQAGPQPAAGLS